MFTSVIVLYQIRIAAEMFSFFYFSPRYDMEAVYFDDGVKTAKRHQLESKLLQVSTLLIDLPYHSKLIETSNFGMKRASIY